MADKATAAEAEVTLYRIITLTPEQAVWFHWIFAAISAISFLLCVYKLITNNLKVTLDKNHLLVPRNAFSRKIISIPYKNMRKITLQKVSGVIFASIPFTTIETGHQTVRIPSFMLPNKTLFYELIAEIEQKRNHL
jgi:hypothetical protein